MFVSESINGVLREGAIAAALTALMIILFLGSWRSTLVVIISIPLSILASLVVLYFLGHTINTMTLGGLALAVGILVDDSTVTIENTHRLLTEEHKPLPYATLHGAAEIAVPTLVSTLAISCVFVSVLFLHGPAKYLFTPLGLAVVFAMLASYALSRTLTPITIGLLLKGENHDPNRPLGFFGRLHARFERGFEALRHGYSDVLTVLLTRRLIVPVVAVVMLALGGTLYFYVGRDFFPMIDGGQIQLHVRAPPGTRIERTELIFQAIEDKIREIIPENEREQILDNIGLPARNYNLAFSDGTTIGVNDGVILVTLKEGHPPTSSYVHKLREALPAAFPEMIFYFQAADMVTQILNFGIPAQIDVRTVGYDRANNLAVAREIKDRLAAIPGIADAHVQQEVDAPEFYAVIDRARAAQFGLTANSVATNLNVSLSSSVQVSPNFWTDPATGTPYFLAVQTPEHRIASIEDLRNTPVGSVTAPNGNPVPQLLENVATLKRSLDPDQRQPRQRPAGLRGLCQCREHRSRHGVEGDRQGRRRARQEAQARQPDRGARPDREHEQRVPGHGPRPLVRVGVRLSPDGGELPELHGPLRGDPRAAGDVLRHRHHAVHHRHHAQRALADGCDHGDRRRLGELDPARHLRARAAARRA